MEPSDLAPVALVAGLYLLVVPRLPRHAIPARLAVVCLSLATMAYYVHWRFSASFGDDEVYSAQWVWVRFCFAFEAVALIEVVLTQPWFVGWVDRSAEADRYERALRARPIDSVPSVDVFIPTYNEELDVLERSIVGAAGLDYPNFQVWVLDDGRRDWLRDYCAELGVNYLRRDDNAHAKAGNINRALPRTSGEFILILDADFVPHRNFLWRTIGFFDDPKIACVQTPQGFFNLDPIQVNMHLGVRMPEEQRLFFDTILLGRDRFDVAFCCGSGMVLRRSSLEAVGGFPTGSITEDVLLTLEQLRRGEITRYLPERLALGLSPESVAAYFIQRQRWCRGQIQMIYLKEGPLGPGLSLWQRLAFLPLYWFVALPFRLFLLLMPLIYVLFNLSPMKIDSVGELVSHAMPMILATILATRWFAPGSYVPLVSSAMSVFTAIRIAPVALHSLVRPFGVAFKVTPKGSAAETRTDPWVATVASLYLIFSIACLVLANLPAFQAVRDSTALLMSSGWIIANSLVVLLVLLMALDRPRLRTQERFAIRERSIGARIDDAAGCQVRDLSMGGALLDFGNSPSPAHGASVTLDLESVGVLPATIVHRAGSLAGVSFGTLAPTEHRRLLALTAELAAGGTDRRRSHRRVMLGVRNSVVANGAAFACTIVDASLSGALVQFDQPVADLGERIGLSFPGVGVVPAKVVRNRGGAVALRFDELKPLHRQLLILRLYTEGLWNNAEGVLDTAAIAKHLALRMATPR